MSLFALLVFLFGVSGLLGIAALAYHLHRRNVRRWAAEEAEARACRGGKG